MTSGALPAVTAAAARVRNYADFTTEFLALGDRYVAEVRLLDAALCYRAAEFFLVPGDKRRAPARARFLELIRGVYGIAPEQLARVTMRAVFFPRIDSAFRPRGPS